MDSSCFVSSRKLISLAHGVAQTTPAGATNKMNYHSLEDSTLQMSLDTADSPARSPRSGPSLNSSSKGSRSFSDNFEDSPKDIHLYLPQPLQADLSNPQSRLTVDDVETMLAIRNVFAFLNAQPLVATVRSPSVFSIFLRIADIMHRYKFTNLDGSTLGEEAASNFAPFLKDFRLSDVRGSREKTIQAVVLGERMRSWELYNEGFVHGVGKYDEISRMQSPKFLLITDVTRKRMERATLDLHSRLKNVRSRLDDFDFPSLFAGVANSTTSNESKVVRFKSWRSSYVSMRKHIITLYREQYGAWPPKAKSKKNDFEASGLNRILLQELYQDFSDLYDVLVDRTALTPRSVDTPSQESAETPDPQEPAPRALRRVMSEYDRSTPPVQPPIPFDIPLLPSLSTTRREYNSLDIKRQNRENAKKLRDDEINQALMQSYNRPSIKSTPFLEAFMLFERRSAHGCSINEMCDLRHGQWIFLYAVLQALPLVVVDAPGLKYTAGAEYFLCEVPKGAAPWITEHYNRKQSWYGIIGGAGLVSLPADVVDYGVDGIYRRSHCWQAADQWAGYNDRVEEQVQEVEEQVQEAEDPYEDLKPPPLPMSYEKPSSRPSSPGPRRNQRDSVHLGLEALPLPPNVAPTGSRPTSTHDPLKSFSDILGAANVQGGKKKK